MDQSLPLNIETGVQLHVGASACEFPKDRQENGLLAIYLGGYLAIHSDRIIPIITQLQLRQCRHVCVAVSEPVRVPIFHLIPPPPVTGEQGRKRLAPGAVLGSLQVGQDRHLSICPKRVNIRLCRRHARRVSGEHLGDGHLQRIVHVRQVVQVGNVHCCALLVSGIPREDLRNSQDRRFQ